MSQRQWRFLVTSSCECDGCVEQLEWEVTGNLVYRHFCRIDGGKVPDAKTICDWASCSMDLLRAVFDRFVALAARAACDARREDGGRHYSGRNADTASQRLAPLRGHHPSALP